jgi:hypothetical protein
MKTRKKDVAVFVSVMSSTSEMIIGRVAGRLSDGAGLIYLGGACYAPELVKY